MLKISPALITQMFNVDIFTTTLGCTTAVHCTNFPFALIVIVNVNNLIIIAFSRTDWVVSDNILPTIQPLWPY